MDPESNRMKFEIAMAILGTERDQQLFVAYMLGILMNHVDDATWSYAIGEAYKDWAELHPEELKLSRERVVCQ